MTEKLALKECLYKGGTIYGYKRIPLIRTIKMYSLCYQLLPCPALPFNQDSRPALRDDTDCLEYLFHNLALSDYLPLANIHLRYLYGLFPFSCKYLKAPHCIIYCPVQFIYAYGLMDILKSPFLHSLYCSLHILKCCNHDYIFIIVYRFKLP